MAFDVHASSSAASLAFGILQPFIGCTSCLARCYTEVLPGVQLSSAPTARSPADGYSAAQRQPALLGQAAWLTSTSCSLVQLQPWPQFVCTLSSNSLPFRIPLYTRAILTTHITAAADSPKAPPAILSPPPFATPPRARPRWRSTSTTATRSRR